MKDRIYVLGISVFLLITAYFSFQYGETSNQKWQQKKADYVIELAAAERFYNDSLSHTEGFLDEKNTRFGDLKNQKTGKLNVDMVQKMFSEIHLNDTVFYAPPQYVGYLRRVFEMVGNVKTGEQPPKIKIGYERNSADNRQKILELYCGDEKIFGNNEKMPPPLGASMHGFFMVLAALLATGAVFLLWLWKRDATAQNVLLEKINQWQIPTVPFVELDDWAVENRYQKIKENIRYSFYMGIVLVAIFCFVPLKYAKFFSKHGIIDAVSGKKAAHNEDAPMITDLSSGFGFVMLCIAVFAVATFILAIQDERKRLKQDELLRRKVVCRARVTSGVSKKWNEPAPIIRVKTEVGITLNGLSLEDLGNWDLKKNDEIEITFLPNSLLVTEIRKI
ncbi:MAG: hypothetical protein RL757_1415 [Bacteroidota bacterium]|jgi:hypothetical protein